MIFQNIHFTHAHILYLVQDDHDNDCDCELFSPLSPHYQFVSSYHTMVDDVVNWIVTAYELDGTELVFECCSPTRMMM
jgi:hypothetical protein